MNLLQREDLEDGKEGRKEGKLFKTTCSFSFLLLPSPSLDFFGLLWTSESISQSNLLFLQEDQ
jgi:hypothetical protein